MRLAATADLCGAPVPPPADLAAAAGVISVILHNVDSNADAEQLLLHLAHADLGDPTIAARRVARDRRFVLVGQPLGGGGKRLPEWGRRAGALGNVCERGPAARQPVACGRHLRRRSR